MSSRTLVAVHRSMERDHDVLSPVRRQYAVSELCWSATCGGTRSTTRKCQHSDILQPPSLETPIVGADGGRSCVYGARPDDQLHAGLRPLSPFPRARSGDLWSNALQPLGGRMRHARLTGLSQLSTSATRPRISIHRQLDN